MKYTSTSSKATKKLAALLARETSRRKSIKRAIVIGLKGDLGSGKTTFIKGFARGLRIKRRLTSPTFLLIRNYELRIVNYEKLFHIDAYRIKKAGELTALGLKKILANPKNIVLIEWAEKIKRALPKQTIWIKFRHGKKENERTIEIKLCPDFIL